MRGAFRNDGKNGSMHALKEPTRMTNLP